MYKLTYIDRLSRFYYIPRSYHSFGASLHKALENYHKAGGAVTQTSEQLVNRLHESWVDTGYASKDEALRHLRDGERFLQDYHTAHYVEGIKTLYTEKQLKASLGEFDLMGRVDRIDEHPDGHLEIIDYKSGRTTVEESDLKGDLAMRIYAYLANKLFPERSVTTSIYCLRSGAKATVGFDQQELQDTEQTVRVLADEISGIDEDSEIEPEWLEHVCPECSYLKLCAKKAGWNLAELLADEESGT